MYIYYLITSNEGIYILLYIYMYIYDDIFYNIYTTFTIIYIVDFRSATWLPYEYWSVADTDTRSAPIFWVARFFFPMAPHYVSY